MTDDGGDATVEADPVVRVDRVGHRYGALSVLQDVSFELTPGTTTAVIGPNGSGKTTLLRIVAGLLEPSSGRVELPSAERPVGFLPQHPNFRPMFTVQETLEFYADLLDGDVDVSAILEAVGLSPARGRRAGALSGGMQRLLGLGQALLGEPPVVILDEPTSDLDPGMTEHIFSVIGGHTVTDTAVLFATHDLSVASGADAVVFLDRGEIVAAGTPAQMIEDSGRASFSEAFLELVGDGERAVWAGREGRE